MSNEKDQPWVDDQSSLVNSWWGAVAALMLLQAYSIILLQGFIHFTEFVVVTFVFLFFIMLSQAGGLRVMNRYLKTHDWKTGIRFWHSPVEALKFCAAILSTAIYIYLLTGHRPFPRDSSLYRDVGILGNLMFQLANLAASFVLNWIWKISPTIASLRPASTNVGVQTDDRGGLVGMLVVIPLGILLVTVSCYITELFYVVGVIGYGMIVLALAASLTRNSPLRNPRNETQVA